MRAPNEFMTTTERLIATTATANVVVQRVLSGRPSFETGSEVDEDEKAERNEWINNGGWKGLSENDSRMILTLLRFTDLFYLTMGGESCVVSDICCA